MDSHFRALTQLCFILIMLSFTLWYIARIQCVATLLLFSLSFLFFCIEDHSFVLFNSVHLPAWHWLVDCDVKPVWRFGLLLAVNVERESFFGMRTAGCRWSILESLIVSFLFSLPSQLLSQLFANWTSAEHSVFNLTTFSLHYVRLLNVRKRPSVILKISTIFSSL